MGCGSGEEIVPLVHRGARVVGIDISPELIEIASQRLQLEGIEAEVRVGSAYQTGFRDNSVDVIFCMSLIHHLDIERARQEMLRILRPGGVVILKEPIRLSSAYSRVRSLLPEHEDISEAEHPLTLAEMQVFQRGFESEGLRFFRLPFVPLAMRVAPSCTAAAYRLSNVCLRVFPKLSRYATSAVVRMRKAA